MVEPKAALEVLESILSPGGYISILFYNRHAIMWRYLMNGTFDRVLDRGNGDRNFASGRKKKNPLLPPNPQYAEEIRLVSVSLFV